MEFMERNLYCILQVSVLGPLIISMFLCGLFYFLDGVSVVIFADDTTPYSANQPKKIVIKEIGLFSKIYF